MDNILRYPGLANLVLEGSICGRNARGGSRLEYDKQMIADVGCISYVVIKLLT